MADWKKSAAKTLGVELKTNIATNKDKHSQATQRTWKNSAKESLKSIGYNFDEKEKSFEQPVTQKTPTVVPQDNLKTGMPSNDFFFQQTETKDSSFATPFNADTNKQRAEIQKKRLEKSVSQNTSSTFDEKTSAQDIVDQTKAKEDFKVKSEAGWKFGTSEAQEVSGFKTRNAFDENNYSDMQYLGNPMIYWKDAGRALTGTSYENANGENGYKNEGQYFTDKAVNEKVIFAGYVPSGGRQTNFADGIEVMSKDEIDTFNYLYMTDIENGVTNFENASSKAFLDKLMPELRKRRAEKVGEDIKAETKKNPVGSMALRAMSNIASASAAPKVAAEYINIIGKSDLTSIDPNKSIFMGEAINSAMTDGFLDGKSNIEKFVYGVGLSVFDNLVRRTVAGGTQFSSIMMAGQSFTASSYKNAVDNVRWDKALTLSLWNTAAEFAGEAVNIKMLDKATEGVKLAFARSVNVKKAAIELLKSINMVGIKEGIEEAVTEVLNIAGDLVVLGDKSQAIDYYNRYISEHGEDKKVQALLHTALALTGQVLQSAASGYLSGIVSGGIGDVKELATSKTYYNAITKDKYSAEIGKKLNTAENVKEIIEKSTESGNDTVKALASEIKDKAENNNGVLDENDEKQMRELSVLATAVERDKVDEAYADIKNILASSDEASEIKSAGEVTRFAKNGSEAVTKIENELISRGTSDDDRKAIIETVENLEIKTNTPADQIVNGASNVVRNVVADNKTLSSIEADSLLRSVLEYIDDGDIDSLARSHASIVGQNIGDGNADFEIANATLVNSAEKLRNSLTSINDENMHDSAENAPVDTDVTNTDAESNPALPEAFRLDESGKIRFNQVEIDYSNTELRKSKFRYAMGNAHGQHKLIDADGFVCGRFGICRTDSDKYAVVHLQGGLGIGTFDTAAEAKQCAEYMNVNTSFNDVFYGRGLSENSIYIRNTDELKAFIAEMKQILADKPYSEPVVTEIQDGKVPFRTKAGLISYVKSHIGDSVKVTFGDADPEVRILKSISNTSLRTEKADGSVSSLDFNGSTKISYTDTGFNVVFSTGVSATFDFVNTPVTATTENVVETTENVDETVDNSAPKLTDKCELIATKHTASGNDIWVVTLKDRVSPEEYKDLSSKVKAVGGYYSRFAKTPEGKAIPGFVFKSEPTAKELSVFNDFFGYSEPVQADAEADATSEILKNQHEDAIIEEDVDTEGASDSLNTVDAHVFLSEMGLTDDEQYAILEYKSSESYMLNTKMRNGIPLSSEDKQLIDFVVEGLKKFPTFQGVVYRNIGFYDRAEFESFVAEHKGKDAISYHQFISASKEKDGYIVNADYTVSYIIKSSAAHDVSNIGITDEAEVIFLPYTAFAVLNMKVYDNSVLIEMEEQTDVTPKTKYGERNTGGAEGSDITATLSDKREELSDGAPSVRGRSSTDTEISEGQSFGIERDRHSGSGKDSAFDNEKARDDSYGKRSALSSGVKENSNKEGATNVESESEILAEESKPDGGGLRAGASKADAETGVEEADRSHRDGGREGLPESVGADGSGSDVGNDSEGVYGTDDAADASGEADGASAEIDDGEPETIDTEVKTVEKKRPSNKGNFVITDDIAAEFDNTPPSAKDNIEAIELLLTLESEGRAATAEEKKILAKYKGWGGIDTRYMPYELSSRFGKLFDWEQRRNLQSSQNNAFFTPTKVIDAMYEGLKRMGFKGGNVLESSMGVGNFFGRMPAVMTAKSALTGVELESYTARIAQYLYPGATVINMPFQDVAIKNGSYDLVIGNVPFGQNKISYNKKKYSLHNYFIISSLDKVRDGGIVAVITSAGTLESHSIDARSAIMDRADVVACYKLPEKVFSRNASTDVQTDLLILRKRASGEKPKGDSILNTTTTADGLRVNEYFIKHPENILGTLAKGTNAWGEITTVLDDGNFYDKLNAAMKKLPKDLITGKADLKPVETIVSLSDKPRFFEKNGKIYADDGAGTATEVSKNQTNTVHDYMAVRDAYKAMLSAYDNDLSDDAIKPLRDALSKAYDTFYKNHGAITGDGKKKIGTKKSTNNTFLEADADYYLVSGLERYDAKNNAFVKSALFEKDTLRKKRVTSVDAASDALAISLNESGKIDFDRMQELTGKTEKQLAEDLKGEIVLTPEGDYVLTDIYLSGNIYEKLEAVKGKPEFKEQQEMLEKVIPTPKGASDITVKLGANYIDSAYIEQFAREILNSHLTIKKDISGRWVIEGVKQSRYGDIVNVKYGCDAFNAVQLLEKILNDGEITATKKVGTGRDVVTVLDSEMTEVARQKADDIRAAFESWIFADSDRRTKIVDNYNRTYNNYRPLDYGRIAEKLSFDSMDETLKSKLYPHQKKGIARFLFGGNILFAHGVGTGKTFEMIASVMEAKRMGIINKAAMVVPNNKVVDFKNDIAQAYPNAKVLVIDTANKKRQTMLGLVNSNDWDIVLIARTTFTKIPVSRELQAHFISQQLEDLELQIAEASSDRNVTKRQLKGMITQRDNFEQKLKDLNSDTARDENSVDFEKLGIDCICVDEAHNYKSIMTPTKLDIKGLVNRNNAQMANDMLMKLDYLRSIDGKIIFGTGTPITNTVSEIYNMMRMVRPDILEEADIHSLDEWVNTFAKIETITEIGIDNQVKAKSTQIIRNFINVSEMIGMFRQFADIVFTTDVVKNLPKAIYRDVELEGTSEHKQIERQISDVIKNTPKSDLLKVYGQLMSMADAASVDLRMLSGAESDHNIFKDYSLEELDYADSKINVMCDKVYEEYTASNKIKGTQIIFCDKGSGSGTVYSFNLHKDIVRKLVERGIPEEQIVIIKNQSDAQLEALYDKVNAGEVRVLIGTSQKMAEGLNVQKRVVAIHHPTVTYKPSDKEQGDARGVRAGNINDEVHIYRYLQKNTFDSHKWQAQDRKGEMINKALRGELVAEMEDIGADEEGGAGVDAATAMAITSGNPLVKEKIDIDKEVLRLKTLQRNYLSEVYRYQDAISKNPGLIRQLTAYAENLVKDIALRNKHGEKSAIVIKDKSYEKQNDANKALLDAVKTAPKNGQFVKLGAYKGFDIMFKGDTGGMNYALILSGSNKYNVDYAGSGNNIARFAGALNRLDAELDRVSGKLEALKKDLEFAKREVAKPFEKEKELTEALEKQKDITYRYEHYNEINSETDFSSGEVEVSYSVNDDLPSYTIEEYNDYGWARANGLLSAGQNEVYRSKFADAVTGQAKFKKTSKGEYMIPIYDPEAECVNNAIVFAKGTIDKPIITSIIEIDCYDETELDKIRRKIYDLGRRSIQQKIGKFIRRYDASVFQYHDDRGKRESRRYDYGNFVRGGNSQQIEGDTRKRTAFGREQYRNPLSNGFGGRQNGESIFKRSQKVDGRSIYYRERPSIAFERRKYCKTLRDTGNTEQRIIYGHKCEVIPKEHYTDRMSKIAAGNAKDGFDETIFITGGAVIPFAKDAKGDPKTAKGIFVKTNGKKIAIIQYDHSFMPEQINDHEKVHNRYDSDLTQKIKKILLNSLTKREKQAILEKLSRDYNGIIEGNEGKIFEEFVANFLSGMNEYSVPYNDLVKAYWKGDKTFIEHFDAATYNKMTDSGGNEEYLDGLGFGDKDATTIKYSVNGNGNLEEELSTEEFDELMDQFREDQVTKPKLSQLQVWGDRAAWVLHNITRVFPDIPERGERGTFFAEFRKSMIRWKSLPSISATMVEYKLNKMTEGLSPKEFDTFSKLVYYLDLQEEANLQKERGYPEILLPHGISPEKVDAVIKILRSQATESVEKAISNRQTIWDDLKARYIELNSFIGFDTSEKFKRQNYYHHEVIEHMNKSSTGTGSREISVKSGRGWLKERRGSTKAISTDFLAVEYKAMLQMQYDIYIAETLGRIKKQYDIKPQLEQQAFKGNKQLLNEIIAKEATDKDGNILLDKNGNPDSETYRQQKWYNQRIMFGFSGLIELAQNDELPTMGGEYSSVVSALKGGDLNAPGLYKYVSILAATEIAENANDAEEQMVISSRTVMKYTAQKKAWIKEVLGDAYQTWESISKSMSDTHSIHQPRRGNYFYTKTIIDEDAFTQAQNEIISALVSGDVKYGNEDVKKIFDQYADTVRLMGAAYEQWVLPKEIVDTMYEIANPKQEHEILQKVRWIVSAWKGWATSLNPLRTVKFGTRNIYGDLDAVVGANPKIILYSKRATQDIYEAMRYKNYSQDFMEWIERGGYTSMIFANEMDSEMQDKLFAHLKEKDDVNILKIPVKVIEKYTQSVETAHNFREAILRYSAYLYFKDSINNNGGTVKDYVASNRYIVKGLVTVEDKAYQLSKDLLGAYDEVGKMGQMLRRYLVPFYSFTETNLKRYYRLFENVIVSEGGIPEKAAKLLLKALMVNMLGLLIAAWNRLVMRDIDDKLPPTARNVPHITLGMIGDEVYAFRQLGSFSELLEWIGFEDYKWTSEDLMAPVDKAWGMITPFVKQPIELISGLNFYPSLSQPRAIRDKWQHFFNSLGVDDIYNELSGKPTKGIGEVVKGAFLYNYDYKESAYYEILDIKREFQKKNDNTIYGADKKSNALYYMKQAVRYKDKKAALKYLEEYFNNGGTVRGIKQSFATLNPMFGFTGKETIAKGEEFIASLTEEQKEKLKIAQDFYENDLMLPEIVLVKLGQKGITDDQAKNVLKNYIASKCE